MTFEVVEPVLVIGLGGVGSKLAMDVKKSLNSHTLRVCVIDIGRYSSTNSIGS